MKSKKRRSNKNYNQTRKNDTKIRHKLQTFCLPLSQFHMKNTNSHLKGTRLTSNVDLVNEDFKLTPHIYHRYTQQRDTKFYLN